MRRACLLVIVLGLLCGPSASAQDPKKQSAQQGASMSELIEQGKYSEAVQAGEAFLKSNQVDFSIYYNLGVAYHKLKDYTKAVENLDKAAGMDATSTLPYEYMALVYKDQGANDKVIASYEKALAVDPTKREILYSAAVLYEDLNQADKALAKYEQLVQVDPAFNNAAYEAARLCLQSNQTDKALGYLEKARTAAPGNEDVLLALGQAYMQEKKFSDAAASYESWLKVTKKENLKVAVLLRIALCYNNDKNYDLCLGAADQILKARPNDEQGLFFRAMALLGKGDCAAAAPAADVFLGVSKDASRRLLVLRGLCLCHLNAKRYKEAAAAGEQALALSATDEDALLYVATAYQELKNNAKAADAFKKFIAVTKNADLKAKAQKTVKQLGG